jgi:SAM-dependent methyltransferase
MLPFVSFIPTQIGHVDSFFELAPLSQSDTVYDLGSGDGRLLFSALEKGAGRAVGIELNPDLVLKADNSAKSKGLQDRIIFLKADVMDVNLSDASVILCYLSLHASTSLKLKLESELRPGSRVVIEMFPVPGWKPARTIYREGKPFYLYNMPPEVKEENESRDPLIDYLNYYSSYKQEGGCSIAIEQL